MNKRDIRTVNYDGRDFDVYDNMPQWRAFKPGLSFLPSKWENFVGKSLLEGLKNDWNFADVGASFGTYSFLIATRTTGNCYVFEPNTQNYLLCAKNLESYNNVKLYNAALGDVSGEGSLNIAGNGSGSHSMSYKVGDGDKELVKVLKLDDLNIKIDIMKIDVEGYGLKVLYGAEKTLDNVKTIVFEKHFGEEGVENFLQDYGFKLYTDDTVSEKGFVAKKDNL